MFDSVSKGQWWDKAWSLVDGCTPVSEACDNCWLMAIKDRFGSRYDNPMFCRDRLDVPLKRKKPTAFAIWSDLFHENVKDEEIDKAINMMYKCGQHTYFVLTKRPKRAKNYFDRVAMDAAEEGLPFVPPYNLWLGVTIENQTAARERLPYLLKCPGKKFISVEPMLGPVSIDLREIDWVICGCESGPHRRTTETEWVRDLQLQCARSGVPFFLKQLELDGKKVVKAPMFYTRQYLELPYKGEI